MFPELLYLSLHIWFNCTHQAVSVVKIIVCCLTLSRGFAIKNATQYHLTKISVALLCFISLCEVW